MLPFDLLGVGYLSLGRDQATDCVRLDCGMARFVVGITRCQFVVGVIHFLSILTQFQHIY